MVTLKYFIKRLKARDQALFGISINSFEWYFFEFHDSLKYQTIGTLAHCTKTELSTMKVLSFTIVNSTCAAIILQKKNV